MPAKYELPHQEKIGILKRLIRKFSTSQLTKQEAIEALKRLAYRIASSGLSNLEKTNILKHIRREHSVKDFRDKN